MNDPMPRLIALARQRDAARKRVNTLESQRLDLLDADRSIPQALKEQICAAEDFAAAAATAENEAVNAVVEEVESLVHQARRRRL